MGRATVRDGAFTLIELLLVVAIVAVLIGMAAPVLRSTRDSARRVACMANLKSLYTGTLAFGLERAAYPKGSRRGDVRQGAVSLALELQGYVDAPVPTLSPSGTPQSSAPYVCPADIAEAPLSGFSYDYEMARRLAAPEWQWDVFRAPTDAARAEHLWRTRSEQPQFVWFTEIDAFHRGDPEPLLVRGDGYVGRYNNGR